MDDRIDERRFGKGGSLNGAFPAGQLRSRRVSLASVIMEDWRCNPHYKSRFVLALFRLAHASYNDRRHVTRALAAPYRLAYRLIVDWVMGIDIPCQVTLGRRVVLYHSVGVVINDRVTIGDGCIIRHGVTIGNKLGKDGESDPPTIGQRVEFGAGAIVIGNISIGDDAKIGAGAVVIRNVAQGAVVVGNPAREVARNAPRT
ncbi:serine acetyltransferase [Paraburkholderia sp. JPY432]|uniref:serine O-acetyltransferase n=1 Tax=Paraburkholderia youngii TaxID=2782701 RepID=UPI0015957A4F|nr:DapH/DapD/GlmU-related protein [Paraburkholderia youngii]NVH74246.1 serine acetyltransferase [Paraburkholderia youngii]